MRLRWWIEFLPFWWRWSPWCDVYMVGSVRMNGDRFDVGNGVLGSSSLQFFELSTNFRFAWDYLNLGARSWCWGCVQWWLGVATTVAGRRRGEMCTGVLCARYYLGKFSLGGRRSFIVWSSGFHVGRLEEGGLVCFGIDPRWFVFCFGTLATDLIVRHYSMLQLILYKFIRS